MSLTSLNFQFLFESTPGLYLVLKPDLTIIAVSDAYLDATMTKRKEIIGRALFDVFPDNPGDPAATGVTNLRASLDHVLQYGESHVMAVQKYDIRRADGSFEERYWSPMNKPLFNKGKKLVGIIHRVEDVTDFIRLKNEEAGKWKQAEVLRRRMDEMEMDIYIRAQEIQQTNQSLQDEIARRKKTEEILQKSLKDLSDFKFALDESSIVAFTDPEGTITYVNNNFCTISKFRREELLGNNHRILNASYHSKEFFSDLWNTIVNGSVWKGDIKNKAKDGTYFWLDTTIIPFLDELGKPYQYVTIRSDITKRKVLEGKLNLLNTELQQRVEEKTREVIDKEQQYRFLLQNMQEGIQVISYDWKYIFANNAVISQSKFSNLELLGHTMMEIYPGIERTEMFRSLQRCMTERVPVKMENEFTFPDGSKEWYELSIQPVPEGIFILSMDITRRKKAEQSLKKYAEELESSNKELERFAYIASHDLQEPLRMVRSFLSLLGEKLEGKLDETGNQYLHFVLDGAERMKLLIQSLLEYSRVGNNKEQFSATDLNEVMQYVRRLMEESIESKQAVINVGALPVIFANKTLINLLFTNLVNNALKYHGNEKPVIEVGYSDQPASLTFFVKDNGIGIDSKYSDKIFNIFQRLHNRSEYPGTGIGLAICKKIVEIHQGRIWVESKPGKGSTFYFIIPKLNA